MKCIGSPLAQIWLFAYLGTYGTPILGEGGREVVGGQRWYHSKERWWFLTGDRSKKSQKVSDSHRNNVSPLTQGLRYHAACDKPQQVTLVI